MSWTRINRVAQEAASALEGLESDDPADGEAAGAPGARVFEGAEPSLTACLADSALDGVAVAPDPALEAAAAGFELARPARLSFL
ncbi:MAG: hypothetical protein WAV54_07355 [Acidimicrobiales bacterium]